MKTYNIKSLRANSNMTQQELADVLGVSVATVSNWERGKEKPKNNLLIYSLSYIFHVNSDSIRI